MDQWCKQISETWQEQVKLRDKTIEKLWKRIQDLERTVATQTKREDGEKTN